MTNEQKILKIAEEEFYRNGYSGTSMVAVAKRAGVTHAMVNYYFRSKEQLFLRILDSHTLFFLNELKSIMKEDADIIQTAIAAADSLFDTLSRDKMFPFLIQDVARSSPSLLDKYRGSVHNFLNETVDAHSEKLSEQMKAGNIATTTMMELLENLLLMVVSPFLMIPTLKNVCGLSDERIESFLSRRKAEIELLIRARYSLAPTAEK